MEMLNISNASTNWTIVQAYMRVDSGQLVVVICYGIVFVVGIVGNFWVAWIVGTVLLYSKTDAVPKSVQVYIFSLCISDIMILMAMLFVFIDIIRGAWIFGDFECVVYVAFDAVNKFTSPFILAVLSATCYLYCLHLQQQLAACKSESFVRRSITRPQAMDRSRSTSHNWKRALGVVVICFCLELVLIWPVFLYTKVMSIPVHTDFGKSIRVVIRKCAFDPPDNLGFVFNTYSCIIGYVLPTACFLFCYLRLLFFVFQHTKNTVSTNSTKTLWKVGRTVLYLIAMYVLCWTPYWAILWYPLIGNDQDSPFVRYAYYVHLLPYVSCSAYPIMYTLSNKGIKDAHVKVAANAHRRLQSFTDDIACKLDLQSRSRSRRSSAAITSISGTAASPRGFRAKSLRGTRTSSLTASADRLTPSTTNYGALRFWSRRCTSNPTASGSPLSTKLPPELIVTAPRRTVSLDTAPPCAAGPTNHNNNTHSDSGKQLLVAYMNGGADDGGVSVRSWSGNERKVSSRGVELLTTHEEESEGVVSSLSTSFVVSDVKMELCDQCQPPSPVISVTPSSFGDDALSLSTWETVL